MLLSPQHLQALDRYHEAFVGARLGAVAPLDWGVLELEVDAAGLAAGQVRLVRFAGILPDGTPVAFDDAASAPAPRDVGERFPAAARSLDVYLSVPREREGIPSFAEEGSVSPSRFVAGSRPVQDATSPGAIVPVRFARANALLVLGDESREDHESIKIAEIVRGAGGQLALAEDFIPPCLRVGTSPRLLSAVREVLTRAIAKQRELAEARRSRESASEVTAPDLVRFLQLIVLDGKIPLLAHLVEGGDASPRECYLALAGLAGQLCAFRGEDPTAIPRFQHLDLRATFEPLLAQLRGLLGGLAIQEYVAIPIEKRPGGLFLARFADERVLKGQFFLVVKSDHPESTVVEQLPRLCKIAAASEIQGLVQAAATGLPIQVVHRPPPQLPVRPGSVYFSLVPDGRYWQGITTGRNLALYLPPPFDPVRTELELLVILADVASPPSARRG
jgi:type VI secretion system protein ImpJ